MTTDVERTQRSPEVNALNNFLDLGHIALRASQTLEESLRLLTNTERVVAPDDSFIVVEPLPGHQHLIIEKHIPAEDYHRPSYSMHFPERIEEIPGVRVLEGLKEIFYGKYIEFDRQANGFYVYHPTGESRALHRVDGTSTVSMRDRQWLDELDEHRS